MGYGDREEEGGTLAGLAENLDVAAHGLGHLFGQGQPDARAGVGVRVGLEERLENTGEVFGAYATAGVLYAYSQKLLIEHAPDDYTPSFGSEFQRVG